MRGRGPHLFFIENVASVLTGTSSSATVKHGMGGRNSPSSNTVPIRKWRGRKQRLPDAGAATSSWRRFVAAVVVFLI